MIYYIHPREIVGRRYWKGGMRNIEMISDSVSEIGMMLGEHTM